MSSEIRVNSSLIKRTVTTRTALGQVMAKQAPQSTLYQTQPPVQTACDALMTAGKELLAADAAVTAARAVLANALKTRNTKQKKFDAAYNACVGQVEMYATVPEDVTGLGLPLLERKSHDMTPPIEIGAKYDVVKSAISIRVKLPKGIESCLVEISPEPATDATYKRVPGNGANRVLTGYAPGTYSIRAASVRATEESTWCQPVPVIVK